jgi:hypothetical protein
MKGRLLALANGRAIGIGTGWSTVCTPKAPEREPTDVRLAIERHGLDEQAKNNSILFG